MLEVENDEVVLFVTEKRSLGAAITSGRGVSFNVLVSVSQTSFCEASEIACRAAYICVILGVDGPEGGVFGRMVSSSGVTQVLAELLIVTGSITVLDISEGTSLLAAPAGGHKESSSVILNVNELK